MPTGLLCYEKSVLGCQPGEVTHTPVTAVLGRQRQVYGLPEFKPCLKEARGLVSRAASYRITSRSAKVLSKPHPTPRKRQRG